MAEEVALAIANYAAEELAADAITTFLYVKTGLEVAAVVASVYSIREQQRKAQNAARAAYESGFKDRYVMYRGAAEPRQVVLGRQRVSGPLAYIGSYGANREHLVFAVILAAHEIDAVESVYFNDEQVTLDIGGNVTNVNRRDQYSIAASTGTFTLSSAAAAGSVIAYVDYGTTRTTVIAGLAGDGVTVSISGATAGSTGTLTIQYSPASSPWVVTPAYDKQATVTVDGSGNGSVALPVVPVSGSVRVFSGDPYTGSSDTAPPSVDASAYASVSGSTVTITGAPWPSSTLYIVYRDGTVVSRARVKAYLGASGQAADANMIANLGGAWTSAHTMTSLAYLRVELDYDPDAFPSGLPNVSATIRGAKVYDPRTTTTTWSQNPSLLARYVATSSLLGNLATSAVDDTRISSAANVCDGSVSYVVQGQTYVRPLYTAGLSVKSGTRAKDILDDLTKAMAGRWCFVDGQLRVKAGAYVTPLQTLDDTWLVGSQAIQVQAKANRQDVYNVVTGKFADESRDYLVTDFPQVSASAYVTEDGASLPTDMQLNAVTFVGQAQQVVAAGLRDSRQGLKVTLLCNMRAYQVEPFDVINVTLSRFGWVSKPFEVMDVAWTFDGGIQLVLKETSSTIWDLGISFSATDPAPNTLFPSPWTVPAITSLTCNSGTGNLLRQADGTVRTRVAVTWATVVDALVLAGGGVEVRYGLSTAPESAWQTVQAPFGQAKVYLTENIRDGQLYLVKARAFNGLVKGSWCLPVLHAVVGKTALPANVAGLTTAALPGGVQITVTASTELDVITGGGLELRTGASWAAGTTIYKGPGSAFVWPWPAAGTYTVRAKWWDSTGNYSATDSTTSVTVGTGNLIDTTQINVGAATVISQDTFDFAGGALGSGTNLTQRTFTVTPLADCTVEFTATLTADTVLPDSNNKLFWTVTPSGGSAVQLGYCDATSTARQQYTAASSFAATGGVALAFKIVSTSSSGNPAMHLFLSSIRVTEIKR
jgi:hypothetical protein